MLLQSEFPPDIRLEKEMKSLKEAGYEVILLANQYDKEKNESFPYCTIERVHAPFEQKKYNKLLNFPVYFNPRFVSKAKWICRKYKPNYIHAHDLPMLPLGIKLSNKYNLPLVFDMHENYPEALKYFDKKGMVNFLFKNYRLAKILERKSLPKCDKIITVVNESKDRLIEEGYSKDKVHVVSNCVDLDTFAVNPADPEKMKPYKGKKVILYTGTVSPERGLDTPVKAMKFIRKEIPDAFLLIIGDGYSVEPLKQLAADQKVSDVVEFKSWVGHNNLSSYMELAKACMIPQPNNDFINTTIPHKLFEYMSQGNPVIVSDATSLKRIVTETEAGVVFKSHNPDDFAKKIVEMFNSEIDYGKNGIKAVNEKYNWKNDSKELINLYRELDSQIN